MVASSIWRLNSVWSNKGGVVAVTVVHFIIGAATGIISGFGIGGGSLLVLYLTTITGMPQYAAGGINLLYFIGCAPTALIGHIKNKLVVWRTAVWCALSGIFIAIPVALLADDFDGGWLRRLFGILLLYIGFKELHLIKKKNNK